MDFFPLFSSLCILEQFLTLLETLPDNHEQNDYDKICTHKVHFEAMLDLARVHLEVRFRQTDLELQYGYCLNQFYYYWCGYWNWWTHVQDVDF